jgi:hypothetical protein
MADQKIQIKGFVSPMTTATLFDLTGKQYGTYALESNGLNVLPADGLSKSLYLLRIQDGKRVQTYKLAVN